jgi:hypothetical protein
MDRREDPGGAPAGSPAGEVCRPNIGAAQRRRRLVVGWMGVGLALAGLIALAAADAGRAWRLLLAGPFYAAAIGFLQHREKT